MPRWMKHVIAVLVPLTFLPLALVARARVSKSESPRVHLVQDMGRQAKLKTQQVSNIFADGRTMRPETPGTVAQGQLRENDHFERGQINGRWATALPMSVTDPLMQRGQGQFNIFCSACHGLGGAGNGPVHQRAVERQEPKWLQPTDLTSDAVRERPVGHVFNSITHGIRTMPSYGSQTGPEERWAIIAYIQALQLSRRATMEDVPADKRGALKP